MTRVQIIGYGLFLVGARHGITITIDFLKIIPSENNGGNLISQD
jgi:hypothetical protein